MTRQPRDSQNHTTFAIYPGQSVRRGEKGTLRALVEEVKSYGHMPRGQLEARGWISGSKGSTVFTKDPRGKQHALLRLGSVPGPEAPSPPAA